MSDLPAKLNVFLLRNFLDPETCASLRVEVGSAPTTPAPVYIENSVDLLHQDVRKTTSLHPADETISRIHDLLLLQTPALENHFELPLTECERPQFLRYREGDFFVLHRDGNTEHLEFDHVKIRKISIVVFLNDSSPEPRADCFCGGSLNFYVPCDSTPPQTFRFRLAGEAGLLVAFTADTLHEVVPVTQGERFTIISWFH